MAVQQLAAAQAAGVKISFVNLWDSNGGGNYEFSMPLDGKPAEAAAWAKYLGAPQSSGGGGSPPTTVTLGSGPDTLAMLIAEDAWQGDAQFTISVNGKQIGGVQTATASQGAGQTQTFNVMGSFGGSNIATVTFLNDAYGGTASTDRNLYADGAQIDGVFVPGSGLALLSGGPQSFSFNGPATAVTDTLVVSLSEDAYQGDAQAIITVDGKTVGGTVTVSALHAQGKSQAVTLTGQFGLGTHDVGVQFINDAWGGTSATDRNLYVDAVSFDGQPSATPPGALYANGTAHFATAASPLVLQLSEDAYQGDAQFTVAVDGKALGPAQSVTALHASGASQNFAFSPAIAAGTHDVAVSFLNDAYGGSPAMDRNLYVGAILVNGAAAPGAAGSLFATSTQHFSVVFPAGG